MSNARVLIAVAVVAAISVFMILTDDRSGGPDSKRYQSNVVDVHESDPEMNTAIAQARASVGLLARQLRRLQAAGASVSVKFPLTENSETEHVWIADPVFDGQRFSGYLASEPVGLPSWSTGDRVSAPVDQISDWMAIDHGSLYGGFTIHVLRDRMPAEEQLALDQQFGFPLPDRPKLWH